jgi:hypothetical protein
MNSKFERLVLDVLKPHEPNALEFARALAVPGYRIHLKVEEVDEKTETLVLTVEGQKIDLDLIRATIDELGGSLHSIDEVEVMNEIPPAG